MDKYFKLLELTPDSNIEDIKKKYRELSKIHHPDKNNGNDAKMKEIVEAYEKLTLHIKSNITSKYNDDIIINETVNLNDICLGKIGNTTITRMKKCTSCTDIICDKCDGKGKITMTLNIAVFTYSQSTTCDKCNGSCYFRCNCSNIENLNISYNLPVGVFGGMSLTSNDRGNYIGNNVYKIIKINVNENIEAPFKRQGNNLEYTLDITLLESIIGFNKSIYHPYFGNIGIKYPKITTPQTVIIKDHKGLPFFNDNSKFGNLIIKPRIDYNIILTDSQKTKINEAFMI